MIDEPMELHPLSDYELIAVKRWRQWPSEDVDTAVLLDRALATIANLHDEVESLRSLVATLAGTN